MGISSSKFRSGGALKGAYAPPLPGVVLPPKMDPTEKTYTLTVPNDKGAGDKMMVDINGFIATVTIPSTIRTKEQQSRRIRAGDKFRFKWSNRERVIASTLPTLPGTIVVEAKPMIFANSSHAFFTYQFNDQSEQTSMSKKIEGLMQEAQTMLLQKSLELGCNAVLSINCSLSTDSTGEYGNSKIVIVTLIGTPCVIMPLSSLPAVKAEAIVMPEIIY